MVQAPEQNGYALVDSCTPLQFSERYSATPFLPCCSTSDIERRCLSGYFSETLSNWTRPEAPLHPPRRKPPRRAESLRLQCLTGGYPVAVALLDEMCIGWRRSLRSDVDSNHALHICYGHRGTVASLRFRSACARCRPITDTEPRSQVALGVEQRGRSG